MSYENLVPKVEIAHILRERNRRLVFGNNCTREYEGAISKAGDSVTIFVEGNPTIYVVEKDGVYTANAVDANGTAMSGNIAGKGKDVVQNGLPDAEDVPLAEILVQVNKLAFFNVKVGNIDQRLASKKNLMGSVRRSIGKNLAIQEDLSIARTIFGYKKCEIPTSVYNSGSTVIVSGEAGAGQVNILDLIDMVVEQFDWDDVPDGEKILSEGSPKWWRMLKAAMRKIDTDNSEIIRHRKCPVYNDVAFFKTNNAKLAVNPATNATKVEYVSFRTGKAVAFFDPFTHLEPYKKEKGFCDCLKGFQLFDCAIILEKELKWLKPKWN